MLLEERNLRVQLVGNLARLGCVAATRVCHAQLVGNPCLLLFALLAAVQKASVVAFVPPKATKIVLPSAAITTSRLFEPNAVVNPRGSTALSGLLTPLADAPISTEGLTFGWVVICAAMTPYVIQLVAPQPLGFFLANYYGGRK